jgi:hypothetical protein
MSAFIRKIKFISKSSSCAEAGVSDFIPNLPVRSGGFISGI